MSTGNPLDAIGPACSSFCRTWWAACPDPAPDADLCVEDCVAGSGEIPARCAVELSEYLYCAGEPEDCRFRSETPAACATANTALLECLYPPLPSECVTQNLDAGFDGCEWSRVCDVAEYLIRCDAEDDGYGTSLCDCLLNGKYVTDITTKGIGALACAQAAEACGPR